MQADDWRNASLSKALGAAPEIINFWQPILVAASAVREDGKAPNPNNREGRGPDTPLGVWSHTKG
jgi:hypothetical protein